MQDIDDIPSRPFGGFDWSEHPEVTSLIGHLIEGYIDWLKGSNTNKRIRDKDKVRQHLTHFVLEAYRNYMALPELCMGVHLGKHYYQDIACRRYHPNHLTYSRVINVTDFLVDMDYLEMPFGKSGWKAKPSERRTTRYRATDKLISLCKEYGINRFMIIPYPYTEPEIIILKDKKAKKQSSGKVMDYTDTPFTLQARKTLKKINTFIGKHCLNLDITDKQHHELQSRLRHHNDPGSEACMDLTRVHLRRIFNNGSFEEGGRFYGAWWQQIPSDYRIFITINNKKTSQLDYSGMHFSIMYAQKGLELPMEDPYALEGYDKALRSDIKVAFNAIINCQTKRQAIETVNHYIQKGELSSDLISGKKVIEEFIKLHPAIKDMIASGEGVKVHFIDSQIAEKILLKGIDAGICVLPIHDGFISTASTIHILKCWMFDAFHEVTGQPATVRPETFNLSIIEDVGQHSPYWVTHPDGTTTCNGPLEGKATAYSTVHNKVALWKGLTEDTIHKTIRDTVYSEWKVVHHP